MARLDPRQLPVRLDLAAAESGLGFVQRALRANGIEFEQGMRWLGLERHRPLDSAATRRIAWSLNVDVGFGSAMLVARRRSPFDRWWVGVMFLVLALGATLSLIFWGVK